MDERDTRTRRRDVLGSVGALATVGLAGCLGGSGGHPEPEKQLPTPAAGAADAPVTVAAFEDYACPHCATYSLSVVPKIWGEYVSTADVRYEWYDFPLPVDQEQSWLAADAARAVQARLDEPRRYFEYAHSLFEAQDSLGPDLYERAADDMGLDGAAVRNEAENRKYEPTVVASKQSGEDRDVEATPTVFVGDRKLEAPDYEQLSDAIDAALEDA